MDAGHQRARIGLKEWASIKTAKGHVLMVQATTVAFESEAKG
jgi:hypothetical protein